MIRHWTQTVTYYFQSNKVGVCILIQQLQKVQKSATFKKVHLLYITNQFNEKTLFFGLHCVSNLSIKHADIIKMYDFKKLWSTTFILLVLGQ